MIKQFSVKIYLAIFVALGTLVALGLLFLNSANYKKLIYESNSTSIVKLVELQSKNILQDLIDTVAHMVTREDIRKSILNLTIKDDQQGIINVLDNQFEQYLISSEKIKLTRIYVLDNRYGLLSKSSEGLQLKDDSKIICNDLVLRAKQREGLDNLKTTSALCNNEGYGFLGVLISISSFKPQGYILAVVDSAYGLKYLAEGLGMPVNIKHPNGDFAYQSVNWTEKLNKNKQEIVSYTLRDKLNKPIAVVDVIHKTEEFNKKLAAETTSTIVMAIVLLGVFFTAAAMFLSQILEAINTIKEGTINFGDGKYRKVPTTKFSEMNALVSAFNSMVEKISNMIQKLNDANHKLDNEIAERCLAEELTKNQEKRIRAIYNVASMPGNISFDEQLEEILKVGCQLLDMSVGRVCKIEPKANSNMIISIVAPEEFGIIVGSVLPLDKTYCQHTFENDKPLAIHHASQSEWSQSACFQSSNLESYISTSIFVHGEKFGTINFSDREPKSSPYRETDIDLVRLMGRMVSATLERKEVNIDLQAAKNAADDANRSKSEFLANMSHEIRTPLSAILGFSELLLDDNMAQPERVNAINTITRCGKHLLQLINDILDLSKIEADKLNVETVTTDLFRVLEEIKPLGSIQAQSKALSFNIDYRFPLPASIQSDPLRIKQIIFNLVNNAIKFTNTGGVKICVRYISYQQKICIDVVDTGIGLTTEQQATLFEAFTQADVSTTRKYGGTGLGLCLSQSLANKLGGAISVVSNKDVGSIFTLTVATGNLDSIEFVREVPNYFGKDSKYGETQRDRLCGGHILLVEDNQDNQALISMYLRKLGATVSIADNGLKALEKIEGEKFDLILMDVQMPVMNGLDATRILREKRYLGPIVALTANAMQEDIDKCIAVGCNEFLGKPIDKNQFIETIFKYLPTRDIETEQDNDPVDTPITSELLDDDIDFEDLLESFMLSLPKHIHSILDAHNRLDWESLKEELHTLKSVSGNYGYPQLFDLVVKAELEVFSEQFDKIKQSIVEMKSVEKRILSGFEVSKLSNKKTSNG